jgi:MFS transporter, AAHS family, 4-hydroxybenzoate transporter
VREMRPDMQIADDAIFVAPPPADATAAGAPAGATPAAAIKPAGAGFLGYREIFRGSLKAITPLLWVCFATTLMANFFLNSWIPLILENNGLTPKEAAFASAGYHVGGTVGGLIVSLLLNRYGYSAIVALFLLAPIAIFSMGLEGNSHAMTAFITCVAGFAVLGVQFGNNACSGLIYPTEARSNGVGFALGIGRLGAIVGPVIGAELIAQKMPISELFAWASLPMVVGAGAAIVLTVLCYRRFQGLRLDERAAVPEGAAATRVVEPRAT